MERIRSGNILLVAFTGSKTADFERNCDLSVMGDQNAKTKLLVSHCYITTRTGLNSSPQVTNSTAGESRASVFHVNGRPVEWPVNEISRAHATFSYALKQQLENVLRRRNQNGPHIRVALLRTPVFRYEQPCTAGQLLSHNLPNCPGIF